MLDNERQSKEKGRSSQLFFYGENNLRPNSKFKLPLFSCSCLDFNFRHVKKIVLVPCAFDCEYHDGRSKASTPSPFSCQTNVEFYPSNNLLLYLNANFSPLFSLSFKFLYY
ncbi:hypothetical protein BLOT_002895 [Blomia tropicalis]|nr:hypothetical protein BLOT_002895 [Blomia tropicalis]